MAEAGEDEINLESLKVLKQIFEVCIAAMLRHMLLSGRHCRVLLDNNHATQVTAHKLQHIAGS